MFIQVKGEENRLNTSFSWCLVGWLNFRCNAINKTSYCLQRTVIHSQMCINGPLCLTSIHHWRKWLPVLHHLFWWPYGSLFVVGMSPLQGMTLCLGTVPGCSAWKGIRVWFHSVCHQCESGRQLPPVEPWRSTDVVVVLSAAEAFQMPKSDAKFEVLGKWRTDTWYMLMVERKVVARGLAETSQRHNFSTASIQGSLSVRTHDWTWLCMMYGLKCLVAAVMARAFSSHGNHERL